jgi:hypothetical protein
LGRGAEGWRARAATLEKELCNTNFLSRRVKWADWYERSHVKTLALAMNSLRELGLSKTSMEDEIAQSHRPWTRSVAERVKKCFQRSVYRKFADTRAPDPEERMRLKLRRWKLIGPPGMVARRALGNIQKLQGLVAPRVCAACLGTLWNRWTTARRFQRRGALHNRCLLGCGTSAEDSIEHYLRCPSAMAVATRTLRMNEITWEMMLLSARGMGEDSLLGVSLLTYAIYNATNLYRHRGGPIGKEVAIEAMNQLCMNAVQGHAASTRWLDERWGERPNQRHRR